MAGHVCLSVPVNAMAWVGIVLVAIGTGFIKPNLSTIVGGLYDSDDPRRDAGFQLFYMSVNIGSFASPLVTSWLKNQRLPRGLHGGRRRHGPGPGHLRLRAQQALRLRI